MTDTELQRENAELRARLAEAEETLKAIREGQVDAVVVHGSKGPKVYSLSSAETIYRRIVETMGEAALSVTSEGQILFCNARFSEFVGISPEDLLGRNLDPLVVPADREMLRGLLRECATRRIKGRVEFSGPNSAIRPALLMGNSLAEDGGRILCLVAADLTELENSTKIQAELRASEERLRLAWRATREVIWDWDVVGDSQRWSGAGSEVFGWTDAIEAPQTAAWWIEKVHPEERERVRCDFHAVLDDPTRDHWEDEYRFLRKDGTIARVRDRAFVLRDEQGKPVRMVGAMMDITDWKVAEERLRQSRADLDRAQAVGSMGWWRLDTLHNVLTWSDENYRIFGMAQGAPLSYETFLTCVHPDDRDYVDRKWNAALRGEPYDIEHRILVDGQVKWLREKAYLEFDADGQLHGGFGVSQDISLRKRAEEQIRLAAMRADVAQEAARATLYEFFPRTGEVVRNATCEFVLGYTPEELEPTAEGWTSLVHPDDLPAMVSIVGMGFIMTALWNTLRDNASD